MRRLAAPLSWNSPPLVNHVRSLMKHPPHRPHAHAPVQSAPARPDGAHEPPERESQRMEEDLVRILDAVSKRGVYIVVGAGGGQRWRRLCEGLQDSGWRGLLVEANARNLAQRWAASHARLHACITYEPRPVARGLWRPFGADLEGISEELRQAQEEHVMLHEYVPDEEKALGTVHNVTCFPLETIVSALRTSTVDLLVLDAPKLADDLLLSVARRRFLAKVVVVRMTRLLNGQDEGDYLQMADDAGLRLLGWFGEHVVLAHPSVSVYVEVV